MMTAQWNPAVAMDKNFAVGQVWTFRGANADSARVVIGAIEENADGYPGGIVSIAIVDVLLPAVDGGSPKINTIVHAPVTGESLEASVLELQSTEEVSVEGFEEAHQEWRDEFERSEDVGVFTLDTAGIVRMIWATAEGNARKN